MPLRPSSVNRDLVPENRLLALQGGALTSHDSDPIPAPGGMAHRHVAAPGDLTSRMDGPHIVPTAPTQAVDTPWSVDVMTNTLPPVMSPVARMVR